MMIFFPSVLFHQVAKNMSGQVRHSLAFNFFPKGKLGDYLSELEIK
jgi:ectoine hydroxylase-related dioxygenase (phytanoyl-CoA dioxygenase family)